MCGIIYIKKVWDFLREYIGCRYSGKLSMRKIYGAKKKGKYLSSFSVIITKKKKIYKKTKK